MSYSVTFAGVDISTGGVPPPGPRQGPGPGRQRDL